MNQNNQTIILKVLSQCGLNAQIEAVNCGPIFCRYVLNYEPGSFRRSVLDQDENLAFNLKVRNVRMIPPDPAFPYLGIEVPNEKRATVWFDKMLPALKASKANLPMALGKSVEGEMIVKDLTSMPHLLLLGDTGSGKTVFIRSLIESVIHTKQPEEVSFVIMADSIVEYCQYNDSPYLFFPISNSGNVSISILQIVCEEMERRMTLLNKTGKKHLKEYNKAIIEGELEAMPFPYIVLIIDEFGDLFSDQMLVFKYWIKRITAVARFLGIHLVLSTKKISEEVVSKEISYNIPSVIQFYSNIKSSVLDKDVSKLGSRGDLLYQEEGAKSLLRLQGAYVDV